MSTEEQRAGHPAQSKPPADDSAAAAHTEGAQAFTHLSSRKSLKFKHCAADPSHAPARTGGLCWVCSLSTWLCNCVVGGVVRDCWALGQMLPPPLVVCALLVLTLLPRVRRSARVAR